MSVPYRELLLETEGSILRLTMNRPEKRNALSARLVGELITALRAADADEAIKAVVLTGAGGAFCAGADLSLMGGGGDYDDGFVSPGGFPELNTTMRQMTTPIVTRIERFALAGGLALVCNSTFVIAEEGARFAAPEIDRGLFPMMVLASNHMMKEYANYTSDDPNLSTNSTASIEERPYFSQTLHPAISASLLRDIQAERVCC